MDMVVLVAISRVAMDWQIGGHFDGHAMDVAVLLPLSRVCEAHVCFWLPFCGLAMEMVHW
jgi:threonine/homoserine efflux transporter RhtA